MSIIILTFEKNNPRTTGYKFLTLFIILSTKVLFADSDQYMNISKEREF